MYLINVKRICTYTQILSTVKIISYDISCIDYPDLMTYQLKVPTLMNNMLI